jgi:hypothetical protein
MPLEPLRLDTLTWQQLVDAAIARLATDSRGAWTLHAPVDPGVTFLELFAYELEQRLFRLDAQSEPFIRGVLRLLGVAPPRPAQCASTVLVVDASTSDTVVLPGGTVWLDSTSRSTLSTDERAVVHPGAVVRRVLVNGRDLTGNLVARRPIQLRGATRSTRVEIVVEAAAPLTDELSVYIGLDADRDVTPGSSARGGGCEIGPRFDIEWAVDGTSTRVRDGTDGLRHSGIVGVALATQSRHRTVTVGATFHCPDFLASPVATTLAVNAVAARNVASRTVRFESHDAAALAAAIERADRPRASVTVVEPDEPMRLLDDPTSSDLRLLERDGQSYRWTAVSDVDEHDAGARVYSLDRARGAIVFGDGYHGRIPRVATPATGRLTYSVGGGGTPHVGAGLGSWQSPTAAMTATNVSVLAGGRDTETLTQAGERASSELRPRATWSTPADVEQLVTAIPGLAGARVHIFGGIDADEPCVATPDAVTVVCVPPVPRPPGLPEAPRAPLLDASVDTAVRCRLETARLITSMPRLRDPDYRFVHARVSITTTADLERVHEELQVELGRYLDPVVGGPDGNGWQPGAPIFPAELLARAARVVAQVAVIRELSIARGARIPRRGRDDAGATVSEAATDLHWEACDPLALDRFELPVLALPLELREVLP